MFCALPFYTLLCYLFIYVAFAHFCISPLLLFRYNHCFVYQFTCNSNNCTFSNSVLHSICYFVPARSITITKTYSFIMRAYLCVCMCSLYSAFLNFIWFWNSLLTPSLMKTFVSESSCDLLLPQCRRWRRHRRRSCRLVTQQNTYSDALLRAHCNEVAEEEVGGKEERKTLHFLLQYRIFIATSTHTESRF